MEVLARARHRCIEILAALLVLGGCADGGIQPFGEHGLTRWQCPSAGTAVTWQRTGGQTGTSVSEGAAPDDPETCPWRDGNTVSRMKFGVRNMNSALFTESERDDFMAAMRAVFGGGSTTVAFTDRSNGQQVTHIWRVIGREPLVIDVQTVQTVRIRANNTFSGNGRSWNFDRWFDPERHLWVKSYNRSNLREWKAVSISSPAATRPVADQEQTTAE